METLGRPPRQRPRARYCQSADQPSRRQRKDRLWLDDDQAVAPLGPPTREQDPKQPIAKAKAGTTSSVAFEHGNLMVQGDRFQQQRGASSRFAAGGRQRCICQYPHKGRLSPDLRNHQPIRSDQVLRGVRDEGRGASGQKQGWCIRRKVEAPKTETADSIGALKSPFLSVVHGVSRSHHW
jgi:hypothetical protein